MLGLCADRLEVVEKKAFLLNRYYRYIVPILIGFWVADVLLLKIRPVFFPASMRFQNQQESSPLLSQMQDRSVFSNIVKTNIFSLDGKIPEALSAGDQPEELPENVPVPSSLPLNLIGTIVHSIPEKSVASIEIKGKNLTLAFRPKNEIEGLALVEKIERSKVIIRNLNTNRLEFIEAKTDQKITFKGSVSDAGPKKEIKAIGNNTFSLKRSDLLKYTSNLSSILQQARAIPNRNPSTGEVDGFRLLDFQPGSIFEQLGLARMDVFKSVNGEVVDSPTKAVELYNALKNSNKISLVVERNGRTETLEYQIEE